MSSIGQPGDLNADHYKKHSSLQQNLAENILKTLSIGPNASVLDVGCGDGRNTANMAERATKGSVIGLDISRSMIESASQHFPENQFPNLHFQLSSIEELECPHPFSLITSFSCFHWLKDPKKVMRKLAACLQEGGELLILTYPKNSPYYQYLETALKSYPAYQDLSANHTMLSAQEYREFFEAERFTILDFQEENLFAEYETREDLINFIKGWINNYVMIPSQFQDMFINDVVDAILNDRAIQKNPVIRVPYTALIMRVKK